MLGLGALGVLSLGGCRAPATPAPGDQPRIPGEGTFVRGDDRVGPEVEAVLNAYLSAVDTGDSTVIRRSLVDDGRFVWIEDAEVSTPVQKWTEATV